MRAKKSIKHVLTIDRKELKEALVFWLSRSPKNNSETCQIAAYMNNSDCTFVMPKNKSLTISFTWDEEQETL